MSRLRIQLQFCQSTQCPGFDQPRLYCVAHSPHIKAITERIMLDGAQISETDFVGLAAQDSSVMQQALQGAFGALSHFEVLTSLAFKHFQRKQVFESHHWHHVRVCVSSATLHFYHCMFGKSMLSLTSCLILCKANACTLSYSPLKLYCWSLMSQGHRISAAGYNHMDFARRANGHVHCCISVCHRIAVITANQAIIFASTGADGCG